MNLNLEARSTLPIRALSRGFVAGGVVRTMAFFNAFTSIISTRAIQRNCNKVKYKYYILYKIYTVGVFI